MKNRVQLNLLVIAMVGVGMPAYYKVKYLITGLITSNDILNWYLPLEILFGILLSTVVVLGHDRIAIYLRGKLSGNRFFKRFLLQYGISTSYSVLAAIAFSYVFWNYIIGMGITGEFLFDYAILGLLMPLFVNGISESLYFYGQWEKETLEKATLEKENEKTKYEVLQNQLSPHFLFNCFNTLSVLIQESKETASKFLHQLSKVYRYVLEIRDRELVTLEEELSSLKSYISLMKHRFGDGFRVEVDESIWSSQLAMVPLTLQMLLENALKHNTFSDQQPLTISIHEEGDRLSFSNEFRPSGNNEGTKAGLKNLEKRYQLLNGKGIDVVNKGNSFKVSIPLMKVNML